MRAIPGLQLLMSFQLEGKSEEGDIFRALHPNIDWRRQLEYGEEVGLGTRDYELLKIKA